MWLKTVSRCGVKIATIGTRPGQNTTDHRGSRQNKKYHDKKKKTSFQEGIRFSQMIRVKKEDWDQSIFFSITHIGIAFGNSIKLNSAAIKTANICLSGEDGNKKEI